MQCRIGLAGITEIADISSLYPQAPAPQQPMNPLQMAEQVSHIQLMQQQLQLQQFMTQKEKLDYYKQQVGSLALKPNLTGDDVRGVINDAVSSGRMDPSEGTRQLSHLQDSNPQGYVDAQMKSLLTAEQQLHSFYGVPQLAEHGGYKQWEAPSAVTGQNNPIGAPIPSGNLPVGAPPQQGEAVPGRPAGPPPTRPTVPQTYPDRNALPPAIAAKVDEGAKLHSADMATATDAAARLTPLTQTIKLIQQMGPTDTGPRSALFQEIKSGLVTAGVIKNPEMVAKIANRDELAKYLSQNISMSGAEATDLQRLQRAAGSPNADQSQQAIEALALKELSLTRLQMVKGRQWIDNHPTTTQGDPMPYLNYQNDQAKWQTQQDPRAYAVDAWRPDQRQAFFKSLKDKSNTPEGATEAHKFIESYKAMKNYGYATPPSDATVPSAGQ